MEGTKNSTGEGRLRSPPARQSTACDFVLQTERVRVEEREKKRKKENK
jgi:hypothetical protein